MFLEHISLVIYLLFNPTGPFLPLESIRKDVLECVLGCDSLEIDRKWLSGRVLEQEVLVLALKWSL